MPNLIAYLVAYSVAVLGPFSIGIGAIAYLEAHRPGGDWNSNTTTTIFGAATVVSAQLVAIIKSIGNGQVGQENAKKLDHLHVCVETKADDVKKEAAAAKEVAVETRKDILHAINGGVLPREVRGDVTVHLDGEKPC